MHLKAWKYVLQAYSPDRVIIKPVSLTPVPFLAVAEEIHSSKKCCSPDLQINSISVICFSIFSTFIVRLSPPFFSMFLRVSCPPLWVCQRWKSVHQTDCFPAEARPEQKEEGAQGRWPHIPLLVALGQGTGGGAGGGAGQGWRSTLSTTSFPTERSYLPFSRLVQWFPTGGSFWAGRRAYAEA